MDKLIFMFTHMVFMLGVGFYFITAMQWYSYKLERVVFHYNRYDWHLYFLVMPLLGYYVFEGTLLYALVSLYMVILFLWHRKLDKKLVLTSRVKRFFLFLALLGVFQDSVFGMYDLNIKFGVFIPLIFAHLASLTYEKILFDSFKKDAQKKLMQNAHLKVVAITASYGKTSIKNFLAQILSTHFNVYKTPRSVNTLGGIVKDINEALPSDAEIYIVEAGARLKGDIDEIARCVNPHIAVVGCIGEQHIEYFKTLENIRNTKMELIHSNRLEKAFIHESAHIQSQEPIVVFGHELNRVKATLEGLSFSMNIDGKNEDFECQLLGAFNAINIAAAIHVARSLGMDIASIKRAVACLQGVEHRLQKIEAGGKIIVDDSFNGNLEGMLSSYDLVASYQGRKVIITPGIVESTEAANKTLAHKIDDVFDLVMISGKANVKVLDENIKKAQKIIIDDKSKLQMILAEHTCAGDVILFSNDAPSFI